MKLELLEGGLPTLLPVNTPERDMVGSSTCTTEAPVLTTSRFDLLREGGPYEIHIRHRGVREGASSTDLTNQTLLPALSAIGLASAPDLLAATVHAGGGHSARQVLLVIRLIVDEVEGLVGMHRSWRPGRRHCPASVMMAIAPPTRLSDGGWRGEWECHVHVAGVCLLSL